jgi:hypothetical protein
MGSLSSFRGVKGSKAVLAPGFVEGFACIGVRVADLGSDRVG